MPHFNTRRRELLTYLDGLRRRFPNFSYQDLTDISTFDGTAAGFYDFIHIRRENARLILKRIL
ncbi:MAG: hypothetical protein M3Y56_00145, partial [Armatimonadota bacterium]|nr:hypothetical protein [Armatimonadota bacterium]